MKYNAAQQSAIDSADKKILCLAAAGSGKTSVLVGRISKLVEDGVDPASILVLTFTNAAAHEMKDRFTKMCPAGRTVPLFCTFHSFCYRLIANDPFTRHAIGYKTVPRVASDTQIKKIQTKCKMMLGTKLTESQLNGDPALLKKQDRFAYDIFKKAFDKMLRQDSLITFDIMCYDVAKLFSENAPCSEKWKNCFKYVFVDEFQDTDKKQWEFVKSFKDSSIFVVGDPRQAVYRFRGADSEIIKGLSENEEWTTIKLEENYRSTEQICAVANKTHDKLWGKSNFNIQLHANKSGAKVEYRDFVLIPDSDRILKLIEGSSDGDSIAILCRTNREVDEMISIFNRYKIQYSTNHKVDNSQNIIRCAMDDQYLIEWLSSQLKAEDYSEFIRLASIIPEIATSREQFFHAFRSKLSDLITKISTVSDILATDSSAVDKFDLILRVLDRDPSTKADIKSDEDIINFFMDASMIQKVKGDIYIGTIHSSKGLEYDRVHLMGVGSRNFRIVENADEDALNLYYVGITRAREHLTIWSGDVI